MRSKMWIRGSGHTGSMKRRNTRSTSRGGNWTPEIGVWGSSKLKKNSNPAPTTSSTTKRVVKPTANEDCMEFFGSKITAMTWKTMKIKIFHSIE